MLLQSLSNKGEKKVSMPEILILKIRYMHVQYTPTFVQGVKEIITSIYLPTQIAEWIKGCYRANTVCCETDNTFGCGRHMSHSLETWRLLIRAAWLLGYLRRSMLLGGGEQVAGSIVINTLSVTEKGEELLENPHAVRLPALTQCETSQTSKPLEDLESAVVKSTRESKGTHALPTVKKLMQSKENWYPIQRPEDYHFLGVFSHDHPKPKTNGIL